MAEKKRVFVSSVQKELELERAAVAGLITTDPFLLRHCAPILYEKEPPSPRPAKRAYLEALRRCDLYLLIIANEYGQPDGELSATHHEYRLAQELALPTLIFIKGAKEDARTPEVRALIEETKARGYKYVRFHDREDLRPLLLEALRHALAREFKLDATPAEIDEGDHLIEAASSFEAAVLPDVTTAMLDPELLDRFGARLAAAGAEAARAARPPGEALASRGLAVPDRIQNVFLPTAAAWLLFAPQPAHRFPQVEILADAYDDVRISAHPQGQATLNAPLPHALEQAIEFVDRHTFHPRRVVGLNNLRLDEYPVAALREALVNAVAHRSYDDRSRKVFLRVLSDRVEISSPGYPPRPLTLAKLRRGGYKPCSRNPLIAQALATLGVMEQRGSGFARMQEAMLNHGLAVPEISQQDGFFSVILRGPAGDYGRLQVPAGVTGAITPAVEAQLNERQRKIMVEVQVSGAVTSGWCRKKFGVTYNTTFRDLSGLVALQLLVQQGRGRATRYTLPPA